MALIGPMKYLTIGGSTYEILGLEITSSAITSALGYTPYNGSTNPNGYISSYTDVNVTSTAVTVGTTNYIVGSTNSSTITGTLSKHASAVMYTTADSDTNGYTQLRLGNTTATSSAGGKEGQIRLYGTNATYYVNIKGGAQTANHNLTLPNADGTVALTSDIPNVSGKIDTAGTGLSKSGTTLNHSNSVTAQTTQAVYPIKIDAQGHISAYGTAVTIPSDENVTSTAVTTATTNYIVGSISSTTTTGTLSKHASAVMYTTADSATSGYTELRLGNTTATTSAGGKVGQIRLYGTGSTYYTTITPGAVSGSSKTITLPNASGTVALTSDIPTVPTITLNGSSTTSPSFYAPISAGTSGYYLKSNGSGAPSWTSFPTIPSAGTSATAIGTTASGGSASTWSKSDHVHNITSATITSALGYTPYNGTTNPNGYVTTAGTQVQIVRW